MTSSKTRSLGIPVSTVWFMSLAAALGTASIYPLQPAIAEVSTSFKVGVAAVGTALACGPIGYLIGLVLLVPLVDRFPPNRMLSMQFGALAAVMGYAAAAGAVWSLGTAMLVIGACSSVGAGLSSLVGRLDRAERRSTSLGIVTAGISSGILAGRIVGGWLADLISWQQMLGVFAAACAVIAALAPFVLPVERGTVHGSYLATLASMPGLLRNPVLRLAAVRGAMWFFAFCAVWSGMAVALSAPPFSFSAERIGLYALAGLSGIVATRIAGSWTDRIGARLVILVGLGIALAACVGLTIGFSSTPITLLCLALFDAGLFAAQVANQSTVLAIDPDSPARFNSTYMVVYFVGGGIGTAFGAAAVSAFGWAATAVICAGMVAGAIVLSWVTSRTKPSAAASRL